MATFDVVHQAMSYNSYWDVSHTWIRTHLLFEHKHRSHCHSLVHACGLGYKRTRRHIDALKHAPDDCLAEGAIDRGAGQMYNVI